MALTKDEKEGLAVVLIIIGMVVAFFIGRAIYKHMKAKKAAAGDKSSGSGKSGSGGGSSGTNSNPGGITLTSDMVRNIQSYLNRNITPPASPLKVDGKFGPLTRAAWTNAGFTLPVTQADYDKVTNNASTPW